MNAFEVLSIEPHFELDQSELEQAKNRQLNLGSSESETQAVLSSFNTLNRADLRAQLMLELLDYPINLNNSIGDLSFLDQALEFREVIDESSDPEELNSHLIGATDWLSALEGEFARELRTQNLVEAAQTAQKLAFMVKVLEDLRHEIDKSDDPDELELDPDLF